MLFFDNYILRALEITDLDTLYDTENHIESFSDHEQFFSRFTLEQYIQNAHLSLMDAKQYRFVISKKENPILNIGFLDLVDYDYTHNRVEVGIFIQPKYRNKKIAFKALQRVLKYLNEDLNIDNTYCYIEEDNKNSVQLFEKLNFKKSGLLLNWRRFKKEYKNVYIYQLNLNE